MDHQLERQMSDFFRSAERKSKEETCALCGCRASSFKNSHSVPQFVLRRIDQDGKLKTFSDIVGMKNHKNGIKNSWTFHIICEECENSYFKEYENEEALLNVPSNRMLAQMALKDSLLLLSKYRIDRYTDQQAVAMGAFSGEVDVLPIMNQLNKNNMDFEIRRSRKIIDNNLKSGFRLIYHTLLDWVAPMAFQSAMCVHYNIDGQVLNDVYDESETNRMQFLHIAVFPLKEKTAVMVFFHRDDRNYISFERQFLKLTDKEKLEYINYLIFRYTEHALLSPLVDISNERLADLCEENENTIIDPDSSVLPNEIPNFLAKEYALN